MQHLKKNKNLALLLALSLGVGSTGCTLQRMVKQAEKHQEITVEPSPLTTNGQNINFELKAQVPDKLVREDEAYKLDIYYEYGNDKRENIATYNFEFGNFLYENQKPTIIRQLSFPYDPAKATGRLMVQGKAVDKKDGDIEYGKPRQVAVGLNTTPLLLVRNNEFTFDSNEFKEAVDKPASLLFYFRENSAELNKTADSNMQALDQYVLDDVPSQNIKIIGYQAPGEKGNGLASRRARELENYYRKQLKTLDYSDKKVNITTEVSDNSFKTLQEKVQLSALPKAQKQEVLAILGSDSTNTSQKQQALQQTAAFDYLQKYVYPSLRAAEVHVDYNRSRKPDYELYVLAKQIAQEKADANALTEEELQYAATLTPLLDEKRKLYEAAVKTTDKWPAYYNLGVVYNEMARKDYRPKAKQALLAKAIQNLRYAGFRNPSAKVYYSLASAYHQHEDYLEALQSYDYAIRQGGSPELLQRIFADKAALEIETGQYDAAINSLSYAGDSYQTNMNLGLSYLLKENYEGAEEFYQKALAQQPNDALAYYSLALIGARTQNEQMLEENLRRAVNADSTFTQKAINDLEFEAYRDKAAYKDALIR
ncbi:tetratricopeptide repeat protein [Pontibacter akesuensis]|uniref:Tetratricopeptide repeat-containing protein n=1 Tax=Pontibacter akesuensis TaxID=388950 RepID=A0A1I7GCF1_9BACT|nr:tetratricopeptide repeat protein [Pontibacter akesuensis]SFU46110.1 Tetratricopeptide repeat-containing protein [Pontibacter akesuensis]